MVNRVMFGVLLAAGLAASPRALQAQECPCNCYFSSDCQSGNFCNWGSLPQEDTCFWRTPKPQGQVGANCDEDYNNWGQCDGICTPSAAAVQTPFSYDDVELLSEGLEIWAVAIDSAIASGGGALDQKILEQLDNILYDNMNMSSDLGKVALEVAEITMGPGLVSYESAAELHAQEARLGAVVDPEQRLNGQIGMAILLAEINAPGSGQTYAEQFSADALDQALLARICSQSDSALCLYERIVTLSNFVAREGRGDVRLAYGAGGCSGTSCMADMDDDGMVNASDLAKLLGEWGVCTGSDCLSDLNHDGVTDASDLAMMLGSWGDCGR